MRLGRLAQEDWCSLMPNLLEADGWHLACSVANSQLMHGSCPWGGRLIKFQLRDIRVKNAPQLLGYTDEKPHCGWLEMNLQYNVTCISVDDFLHAHRCMRNWGDSCSIIRDLVIRAM
jgi:hypothetical protein